jgi:hypothetical protein
MAEKTENLEGNEEVKIAPEIFQLEEIMMFPGKSSGEYEAVFCGAFDREGKVEVAKGLGAEPPRSAFDRRFAQCWRRLNGLRGAV